MEGISSHFSHNGPINFISRPDCDIFKDASVDTHIDLLYENLGPVVPTGVNYVYLTFAPRNICTCRSPKFYLKITNFKLI